MTLGYLINICLFHSDFTKIEDLQFCTIFFLGVKKLLFWGKNTPMKFPPQLFANFFLHNVSTVPPEGHEILSPPKNLKIYPLRARFSPTAKFWKNWHLTKNDFGIFCWKNQCSVAVWATEKLKTVLESWEHVLLEYLLLKCVRGL